MIGGGEGLDVWGDGLHSCAVIFFVLDGYLWVVSLLLLFLLL